jgi:uncharacterized protein (DUF849 family)
MATVAQFEVQGEHPWDEQVKATVDCYNAGASMLHFRVRNPATGMSSGKSYELWEIRTSRMCKEKYILSQATESGLAVGVIF